MDCGKRKISCIYKMPVDIFGRTYKSSAPASVISGGISVGQANSLFIRRDGTNHASADINLDSHKLINVADPVNDQDAATKNFVENRTPMPTKKFQSLCASNANTSTWGDFQTIPPGLLESEFDELPSGLYGGFTGFLPASRIRRLPPSTKGLLLVITYQQPVDRNKYYRWINSMNGGEWTAYFKQGEWFKWSISANVLRSRDGTLDMNKKKITGLDAPTANTDAATKEYVDTSNNYTGTGSGSTTTLPGVIFLEKQVYRHYYSGWTSIMGASITLVRSASNLVRYEGQIARGNQMHDIRVLGISQLSTEHLSPVFFTGTFNTAGGNIQFYINGDASYQAQPFWVMVEYTTE